jgi:hypothetical protein
MTDKKKLLNEIKTLAKNHNIQVDQTIESLSKSELQLLKVKILFSLGS